MFQTNVPSDPALRIAIGQDIIDKIVDNSEDGRDKNGKKFVKPANKYSNAYKDSLEFKAFGKTSKVNMTLTGSMLDAIQIEQATEEEIVIGFGDDKLNNNKAHGHITGNVGKTRDFFGLSDKQMEEIRSDYKDTVEDLIEDSKPELSALELFLLEAIARRGTDFGEEG